MMNNAYENRRYYGSDRAVSTDCAQYRPKPYGSGWGESARYTSEQELRKLLRDSFCGVDTCSLVGLHKSDVEQSECRQIYFLSTLERICTEENRMMFTSVSVWDELHSLYHRNDEVMKRFAKRAIDFVQRMNAKGLLMLSERRSADRMHADQELFLIVCEEYVRGPVTILTQDNALAEALLRQNSNRMTDHHPIAVRRINMSGFLGEFSFGNEAEPVRVKEPVRKAEYPHAKAPVYVKEPVRRAEYPHTKAPVRGERRRREEPMQYRQGGLLPELRGLWESIGEKMRSLCDRVFFNN